MARPIFIDPPDDEAPHFGKLRLASAGSITEHTLVVRSEGIIATVNHHTGRLALLLAPLLLLGACGSPEHRTARLLNDRLQERLGPDLKAGHVTLQPIPDGALVTLLENSPFANSNYALDDIYPDIRASVIEAMLDPMLMQVRVADTTNMPEDQRQMRVRNVRQYFTANGLSQVLQPTDPLQATPASGPAGLAVTINVQCPHRHDGTGYGDGRAKPDCQ